MLSNKLVVPVLFWFFAFVRLLGWAYASSLGIKRSIQLRNGEIYWDTEAGGDAVGVVGVAMGGNDDGVLWGWPFVPVAAFGACVDFIISVLIVYHFHKTQRDVIKRCAVFLPFFLSRAA